MQCTFSEMQTLFNYVYTTRACITDIETAFILWGYLKYFFYFHKLFIFITSFAVSACFKQMARRGQRIPVTLQGLGYYYSFSPHMAWHFCSFTHYLFNDEAFFVHNMHLWLM